MIGRLAVLGFAGALGASAQNFVIRAWFPDGAALEMHTETSGSNAQTSISGGGRIRYGQISRIVLDGAKTVVFAYDLEVERAPEAGGVNIRIMPASGEKPNTPTVSGVRQFLGVKIGQEVKIDILENPSNGERVFDVLRPIDIPNPSGRGPMIASVPNAAETPRLMVNGRALAVRSRWTAGKPVRLYLPGQGAYYLYWQNRPGYRLAGYVEKNRLIFLVDSQYVEMTAAGNIMNAERGPVWVYHDAGYTAASAEAEISDAKNPD